MKHNKEFDCVQMKNEVQERLLREIAEFGEDGAARLRGEQLADDPILGSSGTLGDRRLAGESACPTSPQYFFSSSMRALMPFLR